MKATPQQIEAAAAAIANRRGGRRGMPQVTNVLEMLRGVSPTLLQEVTEDAEAALAAVGVGAPEGNGHLAGSRWVWRCDQCMHAWVEVNQTPCPVCQSPNTYKPLGYTF